MGKSITITGQDQDHRTLELAGDINVFLAAELHRCCLQISAGASGVAIDCSQVASFDIAALQIMVALKDALAARGGTFGMSGLSAEVLETIRMAGLEKRLGLRNRVAAKGDAE